jgi:hypothetical protein
MLLVGVTGSKQTRRQAQREATVHEMLAEAHDRAAQMLDIAGDPGRASTRRSRAELERDTAARLRRA